MGRVLEAAVALAVPREIRRGFFADGEHGRSPDEAVVLISNVERLARRVADGIVRPRRELVLAAVHRPRVARARLRGLKPENTVGHHVDPGSGGPLARAQGRDVLTAVRRESPEAVEELEIQRGRSNGFDRLGRRAVTPRGRPRPRSPESDHLLGQRATTCQNHNSRRSLQQDLVRRRHDVGPEHEDAPMCRMALVAGCGLARPHHGLEGLLEARRVGGGLCIQNDQVGGNPLPVPVLVRPQELPCDLPFFHSLDLHQRNR